MADERTQEQRDAEAALDEAIERVYRAYGGAHLPTQWVVVLAVVGADDAGDFSESIPIPQSGMPRHHVIGLLRDECQW